MTDMEKSSAPSIMGTQMRATVPNHDTATVKFEDWPQQALGGILTWHATLERRGQFLRKLSMHLSFVPTIPLPGIIQEK